MQRTFILACAVGSVLAVTAGACGSVSLVGATSSPVRIAVARPCAAHLGAADDVSNPDAGSALVPPNPVAGLICRYGPPSSGQSIDAPRPLYSQVRLIRAQAVELAGVIDAMSTAVPPNAHCPAERPSASIIAFAYANAPDVDLWFKDSGCQTIDNGRVKASEIANPPFDGPFESLISAWAPGPS